MKTDAKKILALAVDQCTECGTCLEACDHLKIREEAYPGRIARAALDGAPFDDIRDLALKCSLCGLCQEVCPEGIDFPRVVQEIRTEFMAEGVTDPEDFRFLWVDHDWHVYSLYRRAYGLDKAYAPLIKDACDTLFFPGCMMANDGPELVQAAAGWLGRKGDEVGMTLHCCGVPLFHLGLKDRADAYTDRLRAHMEATGARRVVTTCPTCQRQLKQAGLKGPEVVSIYQLMAEAGIRVPVTGGRSVTVHDSCSDRSGELGRVVRSLLGDYEIREMRHHGANTLCCGCGGIVPAVDPDTCAGRAETRLAEVEETGADLCLTYCTSCAYKLGVHTREKPVRNVLELLFDNPMDHAAFDEKAYGMWQGEAGEALAGLLQHSKLAQF